MAAARAKSFAVFAAERSGGKGQKHLLPKNVFEQKTTLLIITDFGLVGGNGTFGGTSIDSQRTEEQVKAAMKGAADRLKAAGTGDLKLARPCGLKADIFDNFAVAAMLGDEVGAAGDGQQQILGKFGAVVDRARIEGEISKTTGSRSRSRMVINIGPLCVWVLFQG